MCVLPGNGTIIFGEVYEADGEGHRAHRQHVHYLVVGKPHLHTHTRARVKSNHYLSNNKCNFWHVPSVHFLTLKPSFCRMRANLRAPTFDSSSLNNRQREAGEYARQTREVVTEGARPSGCVGAPGGPGADDLP